MSKLVQPVTRIIILFLGICGYLLAAPAMAQLSSGDIPQSQSVRSDFGSSKEIEKDLNNILRGSTSDFMDAIQGYEVAFTDLLIDKLKDELVEALADAMPTGSLGAKVIKKYQDKKDKSLAEEIDRLKAIAKKALNNQIKMGYQKLKVDLAKANSKLKPHPDVVDGLIVKKTDAVNKTLWGEHVSNIEEYYPNQHTNDLLKYRDMSVGDSQADNVVENGWISSVTTGILMQEAEGYQEMAKKISKNKFELGDDDTPEAQLMSLSVYDRMRLQRKALDKANANKNAMRTVTGQTNRAVQSKLHAEYRGKAGRSLGTSNRYGDTDN